MILTERRKTQKTLANQLRPSRFLNDLDLQTILHTTSVKTEGNMNTASKNENQITNRQLRVISENHIVQLLPSIEEKFVLKSKLINPSKERSVSYILKNVAQESSLQQQKIENKLPVISKSPEVKTLPKHSRYFKNEELKKVEFRPSIMVIDFVNNIMKKGQIDGSPKPLTKKLQRKQTRFVKQYF
ncbi:unnamed protein product [Paramecium sonneborni]|uniref:Uncharacterized protein n=1 Tax=Paramecium sonneborni TaxID=65129 RepID=A0A8S1PG81_9CILI|nr:unnamed protein product [Paramecium sonneborni]